MPEAPAESLPALPDQAEHLIRLGLAKLAGIEPTELRKVAASSAEDGGEALLVIHHERLPASVLAAHLCWQGKPAFVVEDMADIDRFRPHVVELPVTAFYLLRGLERGDALRNWSPDEAAPALAAAGRTPLTLGEGLHWLLQQPEALERNHCFMTIASRLRLANGRLDARTPAVWISNGTGRDGAHRRGAAKVGWCWAGNRHTWLGFASAAQRAYPSAFLNASTRAGSTALASTPSNFSELPTM